MQKNLTKAEWLEVINLYKQLGIKEAVRYYIKFKKNIKYLGNLKIRIRNKAILFDNKCMEPLQRLKGSGRSKNSKRDDSDIPSIIDELTEENKREILDRWIKEQRDKKDKESLNSYKTLKKSLKAKILMLHITTFYKQKITIKYKYDYLKPIITKIFIKNKGIYESGRLSIILETNNININERTLRHYMFRCDLITLTGKKKRKYEYKNTSVKFVDLVKRNYNPEKDNIIATDVSYIPADTIENNVYLSFAISHKTKLIESWKISRNNNSKLILETINDLKRTNFIFHSDHGSQYSSNIVLNKLEQLKAQTSMSRVGNSLDKREIEYFFGCMKGEYLNHFNTSNMKIDEITNHISWYINWYKNSRVQKVLNWKTPTYASVINF